MRDSSDRQAGNIGGWIGLLIVLLVAGAIVFAALRPEPDLVVYKSKYCGCCTKWVEHVENAGISTRVADVENLDAIKRDLGLPTGLASCHTAIADGRYVIEGHVPAAEIVALLENKPEIHGIAVPGMPIGSPGMEGPDPVIYEVLAFNESGDIVVRARYRELEEQRSSGADSRNR